MQGRPVQHWGNKGLLGKREACARERILRDQHARDCDRRAPGTSNGLSKALSERLNKLERRNALASLGTRLDQATSRLAPPKSYQVVTPTELPALRWGCLSPGSSARVWAQRAF
jgi:hypothetical protein